MGEWVRTMLGDLAAPGRSVISGPFGSEIGKKFFKSEGVPVIRGNNLTTDHRKFIDDGFVFVTEEKADDLNAYAMENDLLFTAAGTIGQVGMIPRECRFEKYVISNKQIRFRADASKVDLDYLYAWLSSPWIFRSITNRDTGSTVPLINLSVVRSLPVAYPKDISAQRKVGHFFRAIDAKIDLNNRINTELEALAKTIYDYWFVQFDFPDANGRPYRTSGGTMVWNEALKREIPAGWNDHNISAFAEVMGGATPSKANPDYWNGDIPFFTPTDAGGSLFQLQTEDSITQSGLGSCSSDLFGKGTIIITARGSVGKIAITGRPMAMNQSCYALVPRAAANYPFVFLHARTLIHHLKVKASGSTFNSIVTNDIEWTRLISPKPEHVSAFCRIVTPLFERIEAAQRESLELTQLRDWLLPLLMNGQVRVA